MPEEPWETFISVACYNKALQPLWDDVADELRAIVARCGWDTRGVDRKLKEIVNALHQVRELTIDMRKPPSKRFK